MVATLRLSSFLFCDCSVRLRKHKLTFPSPLSTMCPVEYMPHLMTNHGLGGHLQLPQLDQSVCVLVMFLISTSPCATLDLAILPREARAGIIRQNCCGKSTLNKL